MVTFGDNDGGHLIEIYNICITPFNYIKNILLIDSLKHNLLSISQLYDKGFKVSFESLLCIVSSPIENGIILIGYRHENIYMVDLDDRL